ncbi:MAG: hypothetical protein GY855_01190 [candidate division Zixibacteria bacterium]|nr:hypothetical protein [candidate division Zixibacteria bacterium]
MLWWCAFLFALGILAFMDTIFNYGEIFRRINSVIFMMTALGLLMRVSMKSKMRTVEGYIEKIQELEKQVLGLKKFQSEYTQPMETNKK